MPYKRTCILCNKEQTLAAVPRSKICRNCRCSKIGLRTGTGKNKPGKNGYLLKTYENEFGEKYRQYEHREVMEIFLGRKLNKKEHVHHKNGNKLDNRIENLEVVSASEHGKDHLSKERAKEISALGHAARWGIS